MKKIVLLFATVLISVACFGQRHRFSFGTNDFLLDNKPFQIISGEMHPARIPREYWRQRIQMAKAMGCNTIAVYVFWNYHEPTQGVFDFKNGNHDIGGFIRLCQQEGMWVLLRPGPYVCGEWDMGGLPPWLLKIPDIRLRCMDPRYIRAVSRYISHLSKEIRPLLCINGGPILMTQIENEYGSYGNDQVYLSKIRSIWQRNGIKGPFYTADGAADYMLDAGHLRGTVIGLDPGTSAMDFDKASACEAGVPSFTSEVYPGWITHWKDNWARPDSDALKNDITWLLENHKSFNLYVAHGGTNFGFTAGANSFGENDYQPVVTSYDYDAPINEQGRPTPKFFMLRRLISKYLRDPLPSIPKPVETISIPPIALKLYTSIWQQLPQPVTSPQPLSMEALDQNQGIILYRTKLTGRKSGWLTIKNLHDYALVFLDGKFIDTLYRGSNNRLKLPVSGSKEPQLDILVEGMGHVNFGEYIIDRKGITDRVTLENMTLMNWTMYRLPMTDNFVKYLKPLPPADERNGTFFKGTFELGKTGDTYFDTGGYGKGMIYINGHNLGRYWNTGPQSRLYCPASWLKKGKNVIIVFDLTNRKAYNIKGERTLE